MIDIEQEVQKVLREVGIRRPVLAAPYEISRELGTKLSQEGLIAGYIDGALSADQGGHIAGWWLDRHAASWRIRRGAGSVLLYLGEASQLGGRMLVAAMFAGVTKVCFREPDSTYGQSTIVGMLLSRARQLAVGGYIARRIRFGHRTYEQAFGELRSQVGDSFRLPSHEFESQKVAIVLGSLGPGGAERQAAMTAVGLKARGKYRVVIGCNHLDTPGSDFHLQSVRDAGVEALQIPPSPALMDEERAQNVLAWSQRYQHLGFQNVVHIILSYVAFFQIEKPSLVQTWMDYSNVLAGIAADLVGVPNLVMGGRSVAPDNFTIFQPYMRPGYLDILSSREVMLTNNSTAGAKDYERWLGLPAQSVKVINNGFEFPETAEKYPRKRFCEHHGLDPNRPVVGGILRFSEEKQPYLWVQTAQQVLRVAPDVQFVVFGSGVMHEEVANWVQEQGLAGSISMPGITEDAWLALSTMDIFLLTSRMEGLPNVLVEAQAMGVVVVTTGRGGMTESYLEGESGLTIEAATAGALASGVLDLLSDKPRLQRMSEAGSRFVRGHFDAEGMIDKTQDIFNQTSAL